MKQTVYIALVLFGAACSGSVPVNSLPCRNDGQCPDGAYCATSGQCSTAARPGPPTLSALLSSSGTTTLIRFSWVRSAGAISYDLYKGSTQETETLFQTFADPLNSYIDTESATGQTFHFHLVAKNAAAGVPGNELSITTVPAAPTGLHVTAIAPGSVTLAWNASSTAATYTVSRSLGSTQTVVGVATAPSLGLIDGSAQPSSAYSYVVTASDSTGSLTSALSDPVLAGTPTPMPTSVSAVAVDDTHLSLSWGRAPAGVDSYDVYRGTSASNEVKLSAAGLPVTNPAAGGRVTFNDSGLTANTPYFYKVVARHDSSPVQQSGLSGEATNRTLYPAPTRLTAVAGSTDGSVQLSWTVPPGGATYTYELLRGLVTSQEGSAGFDIATSTTPSSYTDAFLVPGLRYFYTVRVFDSNTNNFSLPTNEASATTANLNGPVFQAIDIDGTRVALSCYRLPGYDTYEFYRSATSAPPTNVATPTIVVPPTSGAITTTDTVTAAGTWYYSARARWSSGGAVTPWAPVQTIITANPVSPGTPSGLKVLAAGAGEALLSWNKVPTATAYTVTRTPVAPAGATVTLPAPNAYLTDKGVTSNNSYSYQVTANNGTGPSTISSATSPVTVADAATSFVCTAFTSFYSDTATTRAPTSRRFTIFDPTTGVTIPIQSLPDGNCLATGLSGGLAPVFVALGSSYFVTTERTMDLSQDRYGRQNSTFYSATTPVSFTMDNLLAWTPGSHLELFSSNVGADAYFLEQVAMAGAPAPGDTQLKPFTVDAEQWNLQIDTAAGDKPKLVEMSPFTSSTGVPYVTVSRTYAIPQLSAVEGRALAITGTFTDVIGAATPVAFNYQRSKFKALGPLINPAAVTLNAPDSLTFSAVPLDADGNAHPFVSLAADLLTVSLDSGTTDVNLGNLLLPNAYPGWYTYAAITVNFSVPINCGSGLTPFQNVTGGTTIDSLDHVLPEAASPGLSPHMGPVGSPRLQAIAGGPFVSAFQDNLGVGTTPTLQWNAPTTTITPNYYRIFLYQLVDDGAKNCVLVPGITQFSTIATSIQFPPGLLTAGNSYFAVIRPTYEPQRDIIKLPFHRGSREYFVETVTNQFTP